jgi:hypothetical protein
MTEETLQAQGPLTFHHKSSDEGTYRYTVAVVCPSTAAFEEATKAFLSAGRPRVVIGVGIARAHPDDQFIKERGRQVSAEKIQHTEWAVEFVHAQPGGRVLVTVGNGKRDNLTFRYVHGKKLVYLLDSHMREEDEEYR